MLKRQAVYRRQQQQRPTSCIVCGEPAVGYNYGAPSCPSCKAFFRRAVVKREEFAGCERPGLCEMIVSGLPCRSCRYDRCLMGGMNKLLVNCQDKSRTRTSLIDDQVPSSSTSVSDCSPYAADSLPDQPVLYARKPQVLSITPNPHIIESKVERMMQCLLSMEGAHQRLRQSAYSPQPVSGLSIDDFLPGPSKLGKQYAPMCTQPYEPSAINLVPLEIIIMNRLLIELSDFDYTTRKLWHFQDVAYTIEFIKALPVYQTLENSSKRTLLSSALLCSDYITAFYSYSQRSDRTYYPDGSVMTWSEEIQRQSPSSTRFNTDLIAAMREADLDEREYILLKMILICNPMLDGLHPCDISILQKEKERSAKILLSYVLARWGVEKGPRYFVRLLAILDVAARLNSWQKSQHILASALGLYKNPTPFFVTLFQSL